MKYGAGVVVGPEEVLLAVLEHEVDRRRDAGPLRIEHPPQAEDPIVGGERLAVRPAQTLAEMEDVAETVVRDLPALGERRDDRPVRPGLDEPVEELHAEVDVGPEARVARVEDARDVAAAHAQRRGRDVRLGRSPVLERPLVRLIRLGEAERRVQRDRQLEEDERDLLVRSAALEQRKQRAVMADRLVQRPLESCTVAGLR